MRNLVIASLTLFASTVANAGVVAFETYYSDADPYSPARQARSMPTHNSPRWGFGYRFEALASGQVESIELGLFVTAPIYAGLPITVAIHSNSLDGVPGDELGSSVISSQFAIPGNPLSPLSLSPAGTIDLEAGQTYWLTVHALRDDIFPTNALWYYGDTAAGSMLETGVLYVINGIHFWDTTFATEIPGAFRITVPAPAAALPLGLACFAAARRRRA